MTRLTFHCPTTGRPVRTGISYARLAQEPATLVSLHCARCGEAHRFAFADASLEMTAARAG